jgi:hypothetical protein
MVRAWGRVVDEQRIGLVAHQVTGEQRHDERPLCRVHRQHDRAHAQRAVGRVERHGGAITGDRDRETSGAAVVGREHRPRELARHARRHEGRIDRAVDRDRKRRRRRLGMHDSGRERECEQVRRLHAWWSPHHRDPFK